MLSSAQIYIINLLLPMQKKLFSLEIFASRFGFKLEELEWGIRTVERKEKTDLDLSPVVLLKDRQGYICINNDRIEPKLFPNLEYVFEPAALQEDDKNYIFIGKTLKTYLDKEATKKFYAARYYSSDTEKYILGD